MTQTSLQREVLPVGGRPQVSCKTGKQTQTSFPLFTCVHILLSSAFRFFRVNKGIYIGFLCSGIVQSEFWRRSLLIFPDLSRQRFTMQYLKAGIILVISMLALQCESSDILSVAAATAAGQTCRWVCSTFNRYQIETNWFKINVEIV